MGILLINDQGEPDLNPSGAGGDSRSLTGRQLSEGDGEEKKTTQLLSNWVFASFEEPEKGKMAEGGCKKIRSYFPILKISQVYPAAKQKDDLIIVHISTSSDGQDSKVT